MGKRPIFDENLEITEDEHYRCKLCSKELSSIESYRRHRLIIHAIKLQKNVTCPIGRDSCEKMTTYKGLHLHLKVGHGISCIPERYDFETEAEFHEWKDRLEQSSAVRFTSNLTHKTGKSRSWQFHCHRSGKTRRRLGRQRCRSKGPTSLGINCPAMLCLQQQNNGSLVVDAYLKHCHGLKSDNTNWEDLSNDDETVQRFSKKLIDVSDLEMGASPEYIEHKIHSKRNVWTGGDKYLSKQHIYLIRSRILKNFTIASSKKFSPKIDRMDCKFDSNQNGEPNAKETLVNNEEELEINVDDYGENEGASSSGCLHSKSNNKPNRQEAVSDVLCVAADIYDHVKELTENLCVDQLLVLQEKLTVYRDDLLTTFC